MFYPNSKRPVAREADHGKVLSFCNCKAETLFAHKFYPFEDVLNSNSCFEPLNEVFVE